MEMPRPAPSAHLKEQAVPTLACALLSRRQLAYKTLVIRLSKHPDSLYMAGLITHCWDNYTSCVCTGWLEMVHPLGDFACRGSHRWSAEVEL